MRNTFSAQYFNPRSHEGSDTRICSPVALPWLFQSTLPRGERPYFVFLRYPLELFQSTLPRGERRRIASAPASPPANFNPRSHEGSDSPSTRLSASRKNFNPRSHEGSDDRHGPFDVLRVISIHAPTRGATIRIAARAACGTFQSTLPRGERLRLFCVFVLDFYFNPRSHEGSDRNRWRNQSHGFHFNPRSHEGSDGHGTLQSICK